MRQWFPWIICQAALAAGVARLLTAGVIGAGEWTVLAMVLGAGVAVFIRKRRAAFQWMRALGSTPELRPSIAALSSAELLLAAFVIAAAPALQEKRTLWLFAILFLSIWTALEWARWSMAGRYAGLASSMRLHAAERDKMTELFRDIRAQRHDFLLHVSVLQQLIAGNRFDEASAYAADLTGHASTANEHIRGESAAVAALLHACRCQADEQQVALDYALGVPFSSISLPDVEQVRLLGNLLQNALEAAIASEERTVTLNTQAKNGLFLLEVSNSTPPLPAEVVDSLYQTFGISTKDGDHKGLGTYVIQQIVKKHHGYLDFRYESTTFAVKIKLPILRAS